MPDEHVFTVTGAKALPATPITLADAGFTERAHLQEWVIAHPEMLGPGVMIVTFEFDRWRSSAGGQERDRLDILGLDSNGRLVVAELKRDVAPDTVEMQALKYAAMASRFTAEGLAAQHAKYLSRHGESTSVEAAQEQLEAHSTYGLLPENLAKPRIVILASSFPRVVTATTVWLTEMSLDISLMRFQAYRTEEKVVVTVSQLYPVPDVEEFTVAPARSTAAATESREKRQWNEASFLEELEAKRGAADARVARELIEWARVQMPGFGWGDGALVGSFFPGFDHAGRDYWPISLRTDGGVTIEFRALSGRKHPPFDDAGLRLEFVRRLNETAGVSIPEDAITRRPQFRLAVLAASPEALDSFKAALDWFCETVRSHAGDLAGPG